MAGYSGTPLIKKLGIKEGASLAIFQAPSGFDQTLGALPPEVEQAESGLDVVREIGLATGWVDNKVCAIDETWSGLRFVMRVKDRPKGGASRAIS